MQYSSRCNQFAVSDFGTIIDKLVAVECGQDGAGFVRGWEAAYGYFERIEQRFDALERKLDLLAAADGSPGARDQ